MSWSFLPLCNESVEEWLSTEREEFKGVSNEGMLPFPLN